MRSRRAHLMHGLHAQGEEEALRALGEDPEECAELRRELFAKWDPRDVSEEELVRSLARALWRLRRSHRMQEGHAVKHLQALEQGRKSSAFIRGERLEGLRASVSLLMAEAALPHFCAQPRHLDIFKNFLPSELTDGRAEPISLLLGLGKLRRGRGDPADEEHAGPFAQVEPAKGEAREALRQKLLTILRRQAAHLDRMLRECQRPKVSSPYERAGDLAHSQEPSPLAFKTEEASFRQIWRLTNLLTKVQGQEGKARAFKRESHDVSQKTGI